MSRTTVEIIGKETVSQAAHKAASAQKQLSDSTGGLVRNFTDLTAAGLAVGKAIQLVSQFAEQSIQEFAEQERAVLGWSAAMTVSGKITQDEAKGLRTYAASMADLTGETENTILGLQKFLAASGRTEDEIRLVLSAAMDMSAGLDKDLRSSVEQINKTFGGFAGELGEVIPEMKQFTKEQLQAGAGAEFLAEKYKGLSSTMNESTDVSIKNYKNALSDLKAEIGESISMGFTPLRNWLTDLIRQWGAATNAANEYARAQAKAKGAGGLSVLGGDELEALAAGLRKQVAALKEDVSAYGDSDLSIQSRLAKKESELAQVLLALRSGALTSQYANYNPGTVPTAGKSSASVKEPIDINPYNVAEGFEAAFNATNWGENFSPVFDSLGLSIADAMKQVIPGAATTEPEQSSGGFQAFGGQDMSFLALLGDAVMPFIDGLGDMIKSLGSIKALMDPMQTILSGVMDVLGPLIDSILTPIVGALRVFGQLIGQVIAPILEAFSPIIVALAQAFVWIYNNILRPFGLAILTITAMIVNAVIGFVNFFAVLLGLKQMAYMNVTKDTIPTISMDDLTAAGSTTIESSGSTGSSASYSQARDINVYVNVNTTALIGEGGLNQLAIILSRELKSADILGAA